MTFFKFTQSPDAVLDYEVDWSAWLVDDTIDTVTWDVGSLTQPNSPEQTTTTALLWLAGAVLGSTNQVTCTITTAGGRTVDKSFIVLGQQT